MQTRKELTAIARHYGCASLLGVSNAKTTKGEARGYLTGILYMMPDDRLCPVSKLAGCSGPCLVSAGRAAVMPGIGRARAGRTAFFHADRESFLALLHLEIGAIVRKASRDDLIPVIRLNGTSDVNWSNEVYKGKTMFEHFPMVQFYDYTKSPSILRAAAGETNWHVTGSYSEASPKYAAMITAAAHKYGSNLAVVFPAKAFPETFMGLPVVNGDETDLRFLDPDRVIVGLSAKGAAKRDRSGFVVHPDRKPGPWAMDIIAAA